MQQLVEIPGWLRKVPLMGKLMRPVGTGKGLSKTDQDLMFKIIQQFKDNTRRDIKQYREALDATDHYENPRWHMFQDLLEYLATDYQLGTTKDIRVAATLGKPFMIYSKNSGKPDKEKTNILKDKEWFFNFVWNFLDTVFTGYTVAQLVNPATMEWSYIPRRNFIPQKNMVVFEVDGEKGIDITQPPFDKSVIAVKYKHSKGILNDVILNLIWKKNARESWSEFAEKFGIHLITFKTNKTNQKDLDKIEAFAKNLGEAGVGIFPIGTDITVHDSTTKGDPYNVYLKQIEIDDAAITKRLLGGTMLTDNGSSRAQGEVHERVHESLAMFDRMMITFLVNDKLMPLMPEFGEDDAFKFDDAERMGMKDRWTMVKEMTEAGYDIDMKWVAETFDVPIESFSKPAAPAPGNDNAAEQNFNKATTAMAATLVAKGVTLPNYKPTCGHIHSALPAADFIEDLLAELSDELINQVWTGKETLITEVLKSISSHRKLLDGLLNAWSERMLDINYEATDLHCMAAMEYNLFEFSRTKEAANVLALNEIRNRHDNFNAFREEALPYLKNADVNWLRTEWNQTIAVGQNASRYHQFMSEKDILTRYVQWQTVGDSKVRAEHQVMDNKIFDLNDASGLTVWPPKDWGCRCEMVQYLGKVNQDLLISNDEGLNILKIKKGSKWDVNRGKIEQVFTANEMYLKDKGIKAEVNKLLYTDYGLKKYDDLKANYAAVDLDDTITKENVGELFTPEDGQSYMGYNDYLGRKVVLKKKVFTEHTTDKYIKQQRHKLFAKVNEVLAAPDEVYFDEWLNKTFQTKYVKFYNDGAIVVPVTLGTKQLEVNSWYWMDNEQFARRGYLIHKKP